MLRETLIFSQSLSNQWGPSLLINDEPVYVNGDGETSRDFCYIDNAVQANILAAMADKPEAVNQVYNVAFGARTTLNQLYQELRAQMLPHYPHLANASPTYRDFRAGDVRHSLADITKAQRLLGYAPTHDLHSGLQEAISWYMANSTSG